MIVRIGSICLLLVLSACVSASNVFEISPGTYTVSSTGDGYSTADRVRNSVLTLAKNHCAKMGKNLNLLQEDNERTRMGIDTTMTINFTCV